MYDVIVIGGGPSGMTASLYVKRTGKSVLLLEGNNYGGQITASPRVENYPSVKSVSGTEFADSLLDQILSFKIETEFENVSGINKCGDVFEVSAGKKKYLGKTIIIASGCRHRKLEIEKNYPDIKNGISYCAVCDGVFYKDSDVAVIGGGDTALQEALYLSSVCNKVYLIHRRECFRGCAEVAQRLKLQKNIEIICSAVVSGLEGCGDLKGIELMQTLTGEKRVINVKGLFVAIGQIPQTDIFKNLISTDESGFIIADESCKTSKEGIFAAGDCRVKGLRQLVTAVSDGAVAAINACMYVDGIK